MSARRVGTLLLVLLGLLFGFAIVLAQPTPRRNSFATTRGTDVALHKFRPAVSPDVIALDAYGMPMPSEAGIGQYAAQEINALLHDKQIRNSPQRKISSKLIYTARMLQGLPAALDVPSLETVVDVDDDGRVLVDISA